MQHLPNILGLIGAGLVVLCYALVSTRRWASDQLRYQFANMIGTAMVLYSLMFAWNLAGVILQILWILFSLIGIFRILKNRRQA